MCQTYVKSIQSCCMIGAATLFSHALWGQTQPGTGGEGRLFGTVRDPSGAAIVGAHVVLKDEAGKAREAQTDREGAYHFSTLQAGHYSLSADSQGFQAQSREVSANGQEALTVNFVLVVQTQRQSVDGDRPPGSTDRLYSLRNK
jgi:hypothetical protein